MDFQKPYNRQSFLDFLKEFLPNDFVIGQDEINLHKKFSKIIQATKLGNVKSIEAGGQPLKVYEVEHESESDPRVTLTREFFDVMRAELATRALIVFYSKKSDNYRFSLMTVDFTAEGRHVLRNFSNPRRYSFYLGPEAKVRTPYNLLFKKGKVKNQDDLISRFSIEVVTKEFFDNYRQLFERLYDYLQKDKAFGIFANNSSINIENFTKKLLGQIVFLYFLQRKGWLGAKKQQKIDEGDKNFLRSLFNKTAAENKNFFSDTLEYLFYDSLNKKPEKAANFYREYFDCQIPFLNGGLFEPINNYQWKKEFLNIPNEIFSNSDKTGILDIFDLYNFTIDESLPNDQEVSIDPEMLGKVFENLLEENLRKGKGTYYTPREIVHYMCQESLINYLTTETKTPEKKIRTLVTGDVILTKEDVINARQSKEGKDKAADKILVFWEEEAKGLDKILANIKVVDPACGSGAFLVGMLQEIIKARQILQMFIDDGQTDEYHLKKGTIQNCIYGVDIDPGAVEIAKLRLWLSLTVDSELDDIEPLPNLDYKIMQGNSLIEELILGDTNIKLFDSQTTKNKKMKNLFEEDNQADLFGEHDKQKAIIEKLSKLHQEYFKISDLEEKGKKKADIDKIEHNLIEKSVKKEIEKLNKANKSLGNYITPGVGMTKKDAEQFQKNLSKQAQIMNVLDEFKKSGIKPFFLWHLNFADVFEKKGGFDIVIANPPYVRADSPGIKEQRKIILGSGNYETLWEKWDLYVAFIERGFKLLKENGVLQYIIPDAYMASKYAEKSHKYFLENGKVNRINFCSDLKLFDAAVKNIIIELVNVKNENNIPKRFRHIGKFDNINELKSGSQKEWQGDIFRVEKQNKLKFKNCLSWGEICYVSYGLRPSSDERFWKGEFKKGIFNFQYTR